jgi:hypothetical protein
MKVTKQTLPLFNEMYDLNFSEDEMVKAFSVQEKVSKELIALKKDFPTSAINTIEHVIDNNQNLITHSMYVGSWEGHLRIDSLEKNKKDEDENTKLVTTTYYFKMHPHHLVGNASNLSIKVKNIIPEQLYTLCTNLSNCNFLNTTALTAKEAKELDFDMVHEDLSWFVEKTNGPLILEKIRNEEAGRGGTVNTTRKLENDLDEIDIVCRWLMPEAKISEMKDTELLSTIHKRVTSNNGITMIERIYEKDNSRLGILQVVTQDYWHSTHYRRLFLLDHTDDLFNYADVDRVSLLGAHSTYNYNTGILEKDSLLGKVLFTDEITLPTAEALEWITADNNEDRTVLLDESQVKLSVKKFAEKVRREKEEEDEKKALEGKLSKKLESLTSGKKLLLNNMTILEDSVTYEGQILARSGKDGWVKNMFERLTRIYQFDDLNWENVFEEFIQSAAADSSKGTIGDVNFNLVYEESINKVQVTSTKTYINKKRINKGELLECLRRAVCYTEQSDFDSFLANVSSCSLKFHRYLQIGIDFRVSGLRHHEGFNFKLPLERKKNLMYIVLGDSEYKVRDTNRLINMQHLYDLGEIMELLLGDTVIEGLTIGDAKGVIKLAKVEYEDAIEKSEKLLEETEKALKLSKQENIRMNEITVKEGYIVSGKLRKYVVANSEKCEVYEYPSGRYICIVDKSTSQAGKDRLINRLYALANDKALAQNIHTLN